MSNNIYHYTLTPIKGAIRAFLPLIIFNPFNNKGLPVNCLVDTGADTCMISGNLAIQLGHDLKSDGVKSGAKIGIKEEKVKKLLYGAKTSTSLIQDPALDNIEVIRATDDGSRGYSGFVTDLIEDNVDLGYAVHVCGPEPMMQKTFDIFKQLYEKETVRNSVIVTLEKLKQYAAEKKAYVISPPPPSLINSAFIAKREADLKELDIFLNFYESASMEEETIAEIFAPVVQEMALEIQENSRKK